MPTPTIETTSPATAPRVHGLDAARAGDYASRSVGPTARPIIHNPGAIEHALAQGRYQTPLRYPGAKSLLTPTIGELVRSAAEHPSIRGVDLLVEPFAGGASTSLRLVGAGIVERILLSDADPLVAAFWQVAASEPSALIDRMRDEHAKHIAAGASTALARWDHWRAWRRPAGMTDATARRETAMRCLFLNRTTFSGILHGRAGPIGGRRQESEYSIGCRFSPDALAERIEYVGHLYSTGRLIDVWCMDWRECLENTSSVYKTLLPNNVLAYLDPPYLRKSATLYNTSFERDRSARRVPEPAGWPTFMPHEELACYLTTHMRYRWILSYDYDAALLDSCLLYSRDRMTPSADDRQDGVRRWRLTKRVVAASYSISQKGRSSTEELLITTLPPSTVPVTGTLRAVQQSVR